MQQNGQFRTETPNGTRVQQLTHAQYSQLQQENASSPSNDGKRGAGASPVETAAAKRARLSGKRPSELGPNLVTTRLTCSARRSPTTGFRGSQ